MPTIPNQQSANDSVIVRVPVPQPVQNTQRKPRQPQQNTQTQQSSTFKKTSSNTPQSIILPYHPNVGNEQNTATQYSKSDAPNLNFKPSIRRKLKNVLRWKKITLSNPGLCTYARNINYNKEKAPTGGIINRGMYFPGGSFIPDMPSGLPNDNSAIPTSNQQPQVSKKKKLLTDIKDILKSHKSQLPINDKVLYEKYRGPSYVPRKDEQWYDEDWHTVTSSNVQSVAYNPTFKRLYVEFKRKKGGHSVYQYENVPDDIHDALMHASSKGKFVYYVLRNNGTDSDYAYRQID